MSRAVCGVCFCPYGDEGDCACSTETHYKKVIDNVQALFDAMREQPAQQDIPKIGCVNHDCDKCEAQQKEPVAWMWKDGTITSDPDRADGTWMPLYTTPPASKPWVGLTDEEVIIMSRYDLEYAALIGEVQRKLKEKNQ